jgi:hypothetical protein
MLNIHASDIYLYLPMYLKRVHYRKAANLLFLGYRLLWQEGFIPDNIGCLTYIAVGEQNSELGHLCHPR